MAMEAISPVATEMSISELEQDASGLRNPQECKEYESEIVAGLFVEETLHMPRPDYIAFQTDLNGKMRAILIDWLVEVHMKYKLRRETLYLAVSLIDRYLARQPVLRSRLQLVGVVGMFVAAKFEQIHPPPVVDFVYITDNTYTKEDIMSMECSMLSALSFDVAVPTQAHFFDYLLKSNQCDAEEYRALVDYLLELALVDVRMIKYAPSRLVSAALLLSNEIVGRPAWPQRMVQISRYSGTALRVCADELRALLRAAPSGALQAVRKKYSLQQHCSIARLPKVLEA
jgi:cyclin B